MSQQAASLPNKRRRSISNGGTLLQKSSENRTWYTAPAKVQIFERLVTRSQNQENADKPTS